MPDPDQPFICYGESFPIAKDSVPIAMDHNPFRQEKTMLKSNSSPRSRVARDDDEPMDYTAVLAFLREKLDENDLVKVGRMLGVEVERSDTSGASDSAVGLAYDAVLDREVEALQARRRAGYIGEGDLVMGIRAINARRRTRSVAQDGRGIVTPLDKLDAEFPHMNRLKR